MKIDPMIALRVAGASVVFLPSSCGSFYAAQYVVGETEAKTACALEIGDAAPAPSPQDAYLEAVFIMASFGFIFVWAWVVKMILKKVV